MGGGAWPFLVGGVICLVNSVNERDLNLLTSVRKSILLCDLRCCVLVAWHDSFGHFLEGPPAVAGGSMRQ